MISVFIILPRCVHHSLDIVGSKVAFQYQHYSYGFHTGLFLTMLSCLHFTNEKEKQLAVASFKQERFRYHCQFFTIHLKNCNTVFLTTYAL